MNTKNIIIYNDLIGRILLGEKIDENDTHIFIKNPAIIHFVPIKNQDGSQAITIQFIPVFFKDFLAQKDEDVIFKYYKNNITLTNPVILDLRVYIQYQNIFYGQNINNNTSNNNENENSKIIESNNFNQNNNQNDSKIIKLFDE